MRNVKNLTICVLMLVLLAAATSVAVEYEIVDLGTLGGSGSQARGINDSGQVVGHSTTNSGSTHAFLWTESGGMQDLGTLGGYYSSAFGINDSGQVVGESSTDSGSTHAFLWTESGGMKDLGTLGGYSRALGINDSGQVVGESYTTNTTKPELHAFLWTESDGMKDLGALGGAYEGETFSVAWGINDSGQVVGYSTTDSLGVRAFLWTASGGMTLIESYGYSYAFGINDSGQVVGFSWAANGEERAFLWTESGGMQDLGTLGGWESQAWGINDLGQVVGYSYTAESEVQAFLWTASDGMQGLGQLGGFMSAAWGINDLGQVVGESETASGPWRACMWIPATPCTPVSIDSLTVDPLVLPLDNVVNFEATIVDGCGEIDALWDFDDGTVESQTNVTSPVTTTKTYTSAGVYTMVLTVSDNIVDVGDNIMVVVYDPTGGFVTGGGWIYSPAGAYTPDPSLTGKANFGFVSKYKKGASVPTGNTEFVFKAGDLNFHSMSYDWLVVTGSNYARFKGWGSINGYGDYRFILWAGDDDTDTFRIKIWTEDEEGNETIIYDNGFDQGIMGGNIIIHN